MLRTELNSGGEKIKIKLIKTLCQKTTNSKTIKYLKYTRRRTTIYNYSTVLQLIFVSVRLRLKASTE